jgi:hypothetical protein
MTDKENLTLAQRAIGDFAPAPAHRAAQLRVHLAFG